MNKRTAFTWITSALFLSLSAILMVLNHSVGNKAKYAIKMPE